MRVFVWEYCCDAMPEAPDSLRREGRAMRSAVLADFARCHDVEAVSLSGRISEDEPSTFRRLCRQCDWTLVIAPETGGVLFDRCRIVEEEGGRLLGPTSAAVRLTGDKWELARWLSRHGIPTPSCETLKATLPFPLVCKPRDGAGSQATFLVRDSHDLNRCVERANAEGFWGELLVQPFVPGMAASAAVLIGPNGRLVLPATEQRLSADGRFRYLGGRLPLPTDLDHRCRRLAKQAVDCVQGLRGYVGVDLILGETEQADQVVEINPRVTTSYVGLRSLAEGNLAQAMLTLAEGGEAPALTWRQQTTVFDTGGTAEPKSVPLWF